MPVLIVSLKTSPQDGFSRNFVIRPSSPVITTPYSSGLGTCTSVSVTAALPLAVERDHLRQVDIRERVARDDQERAVQITRDLPDRATVPAASPRRCTGGASRCAAIAVAVLDHRGEVRRVTNESSMPWALQKLEDVPETGLVDDRHHRLGTIDRQRSKTASLGRPP